MFWVYFFFLLDDVKLFLALVDMNYLIVISVNNTMEANYFVVFLFSSNRKKNNWFWANKFILRASCMRGKEFKSFSFSPREKVLGTKFKV